MTPSPSRITIHMAASLDGFIARRDGSVDWLETSDSFEGGDPMTPEFMASVVDSIDAYVMGSRTYETALDFESKGFGWAYGDKPTFVLTRRDLPKVHDSVEFCSGNLVDLVTVRWRPVYSSIWVVGGGTVAGDFLRLGFADEVRSSVLPVVIGDGISFFEGLDRVVPLHLVEAKAFENGMVALRHEVKK